MMVGDPFLSRNHEKSEGINLKNCALGGLIILSTGGSIFVSAEVCSCSLLYAPSGVNLLHSSSLMTKLLKSKACWLQRCCAYLRWALGSVWSLRIALLESPRCLRTQPFLATPSTAHYTDPSPHRSHTPQRIAVIAGFAVFGCSPKYSFIPVGIKQWPVLGDGVKYVALTMHSNVPIPKTEAKSGIFCNQQLVDFNNRSLSSNTLSSAIVNHCLTLLRLLFFTTCSCCFLCLWLGQILQIFQASFG